MLLIWSWRSCGRRLGSEGGLFTIGGCKLKLEDAKQQQEGLRVLKEGRE
jgi:hypothetical protein